MPIHISLIARRAVAAALHDFERRALNAKNVTHQKAGSPIITGMKKLSGSVFPPTRWRNGHTKPTNTKTHANPMQQPPEDSSRGGFLGLDGSECVVMTFRNLDPRFQGFMLQVRHHETMPANSNTRAIYSVLSIFMKSMNR